MPDDPQPEVAPNDYPMTRTEWSRLHRLLSIGSTRVNPTTGPHDRPDGISAERNELTFQFLPAVKATTFSVTASRDSVPGEITHACLSAKGLHLWFKVKATARSRAIRIGDVVSVEQVL